MRKTSFFSSSLSCLLLGGCVSDKVPQKGDLVTWKETPQLVVKTEITDRREWVMKEKGSHLYEPEKEHYLGKFPIDYSPKKYPMLTESEVYQLEKPHVGFNLEFDLALNGSKFESTNKSTFGYNSLDHKDQIKVSINGSSTIEDPKEYLKKLKQFDVDQEASKKYGLECFLFPLDSESEITKCYGKSKNSESQSIFVEYIGDQHAQISSYVPELKVRVTWSVHLSHLHDWKSINENIWRLITTWNVSPIRN